MFKLAYHLLFIIIIIKYFTYHIHSESRILLHRQSNLKLLETVFSAWVGNLDALGVLCDLSKAFDCVFHETLVRQLYHNGIRYTTLDLLVSYLGNMIHKVEVNGQRSLGSLVTMGVRLRVRRVKISVKIYLQNNCNLSLINSIRNSHKY